LNYFNYFTEIEDTFIRRRGKHLLLSSMDWALIESWKERGVPLFVALRAIEHAFDSYESKPRKRTVKTLMYCQEEVEAQYAEWLESQVGAAAGATSEVQDGDQETPLPFPRDAIILHLSQARETLELLISDAEKSDDFDETIQRVIAQLESLEKDFAGAARPNAERLEESLSNLEKMIDAALLAKLSPDDLSKTRVEVEKQLASYRKRMDAATYQQTIDNLLLKSLREQHGVPRLSLFYL
jgi:hypothetical protein